MNNGKLSEFYDNEGFALSADLLKFFLMPFVFFALLGFPGTYGKYVSVCSNFAASAFFILSGFFTLMPDKDSRIVKLKRGFKRSLVFFSVLFIGYVIMNIIYLAYFDSLGFFASIEFLRKRTFFDFLILNRWPLPMGNSIWFIQSLTYAYLFFLIIEKLKLAKFYIPILIILAVFTLATGEFAAFLGFPHFGYSHIPGGAITRAIPYMLIGMLIRKNADKVLNIKRFIYVIIFFVGIILSVAEIRILSHFKMLIYTGHMIGFGIMAISVCCFALSKPIIKDNFLGYHGRSYARRMYALCQPVSIFTRVICSIIKPEFSNITTQYGSIISFVICLIIAFLIGIIKYAIAMEKNIKNLS